MSRIETHPAYRAFFADLGLRTAADFLRLDGEILGGHPDRHVLRLTLGGGRANAEHTVRTSARKEAAVGAREAAGQAVPSTEYSVLSTESTRFAPACQDSEPLQAEPSVFGAPPLGVYLKKEHHVSWRDRLAHAWLGFGWVSKSTREARILRQVERAGIGCPRALAWGEAQGRAFLLVREEPAHADLREYLRAHPRKRPEIAESLAQAVARIHAAGFFHRDLSSKHILIGRDDEGYRFCFLDWQRARRLDRVNWRRRLADLATLDATLAAECASPRERLLFWNAYVQASGDPIRALWRRHARNGPAPKRAGAARSAPNRLLHVLCRLSARLQGKRRIRELRQAPLPLGQQNLIWLDGEALCVTRQFLQDVGTPPVWLQASDIGSARNAVDVATIAGTSGRPWRLARRWSHRPVHWLLHLGRRTAFPAPEFEHAAAMIRLQRYGVEVPRLLALGHRRVRPWRTESFLLVEPPTETAPLVTVLETADPKARRRLLREAGALWRRIHLAGYVWRGHTLTALAVSLTTEQPVLTGVEWLQRHASAPDRLAWRDFRRLFETALPNLSSTDKLRFALGYFGRDGTPDPACHSLPRDGAAGKLLRRLVRASRQARHRRGWQAWRERRVS